MDNTTEPTPLDTLIEDRLVIIEALAIARRRCKPTLEKELTEIFNTLSKQIEYEIEWERRYTFDNLSGAWQQMLGRVHRVSNYQPQAINSTELEQQVAKRVQKKMQSLKEIVNKKESWINLFDTKPIMKKSLKGKTKVKH